MKKTAILSIIIMMISCNNEEPYTGYLDLIKEYEKAYNETNIGYGYAPFGKRIGVYKPDYEVPPSVFIPLINKYQMIDKKWDSIYLEALTNKEIRLPNKMEINFKLLLIESRMKLMNQNIQKK